MIVGDIRAQAFSKRYIYLFLSLSFDRALIDEGTEAPASFDEANQSSA